MENFNYDTIIHIIGKYGCHQTTLCHLIEKDAKEKINSELKFQFEIFFETQLESIREELIKENPNFLEYKESPIIFLTNSSDVKAKKQIIGSYPEFYKWLVSNLGYYENRTEKDCEEETLALKRNFMHHTKNTYCYMDLICEGKNYNRIIFELFSSECPITSKNFAEICKGKTKNKMGELLTYEGTLINRIVKDGYIQGGDLKRIGVKSAKSIYDGEFADENYNIHHNQIGILGMVKKSGRNHSNESQFYVTLSALQSFDKYFVAFGRVIEGLNVILAIQDCETYLQRPSKLIKVAKCGEYTL